MSNPIALITGAGSGIGRACAVALSRAGWTVVLTGRHCRTLDTTSRLLTGPMLIHTADVSRPQEVRELFIDIEERFGRLDLLFNNAGRGTDRLDPDDLSTELWDEVIGVNLNGAFYCARAAFGLMKRQNPKGGRIINNGSISAHAPRPGSIAYTTSKHAITGLTRSLSLDGRAHNIACGQIDIGNAASDMTARMAEGVPQADGSIRAEPRMPLEEVAGAVVHMAGLPLSTNVQFMTIMATAMPFIGRG